MMMIGKSAGDEIAKSVSAKLQKSVNDINTASQKLKVKTRKNIFFSAGFTLLLLLLAVLGILYAWKWHDGTQIAEMRIEKMLENEKEKIRKQAVAEYKASDDFVIDGATYVANNFYQLRILETFYQEMPIKDKKDLGLFDYLNKAHKEYQKEFGK